MPTSLGVLLSEKGLDLLNKMKRQAASGRKTRQLPFEVL